jgi:hypothetical protein
LREQAVADYEAFFDPESTNGCTLGPALVEMLKDLTQLSADDASVLGRLSDGDGNDDDCEGIDDRNAQRHHLVCRGARGGSICDALGNIGIMIRELG